MDAYARLEDRFARIARIESACSMLHWDQSVMMPRGGADARGDQLATLGGLAHEMLIRGDVAEWLAEAEAASMSDEWRRANLREMARRHRHAAAVPGDLVEAFTRATTRCEMAWREARAAGDFAGLLPLWREVLRLVREKAAAKAAALGLSPYDALLDLYDPGRRAAELDRIFGAVQGFLPDLIGRVLERQASAPAPVQPAGPFPVAGQRALAERLMLALGFDFAHGRLDVSTHPFSSGGPDDVRITTRYDEADCLSSLMGVLHETGHAMYSRGLPRDWRDQPVGDDRGMTVHESQSLIVEMVACRTRAFAVHLGPLLADTFGADPAWEPDNVYRLLARVERGFIRVDADEVTYPAHVILRYRLERAMVEGTLDLGDLPGAWDDGIERLLGIRPPGPREGCLQDIHWPDGAFGYFPTYSLGAMTAVQFFQSARVAEPTLMDELGRGRFAPLMSWLCENVHARGCLFDTDGLLRATTGRVLDPTVFRAYLEDKYLAA